MKPSLPRSLGLLAALACTALLAHAAPVKIGFLVKQPEEPWFQLEWKFADQAAKELGFSLVKIGATDGFSFQNLASKMTGVPEDEYKAMMIAGGRPAQGNRSKTDKNK